MEWLTTLQVVTMLATACFIMYRLAMHLEAPKRVPPTGGPVGIGGFLIIPMLGFVWCALTAAIAFYMNAQNPAIRLILTGSYIPLPLQRTMVLTFLCQIAVAASAVTTLFFIYRRKSGVKHMAALHYALLIVAGFCAFALETVMRIYLDGYEPNELRALWPMIVGPFAVIMAAYFYKSRRVRNTFGNRGEPPISGSKVGAE